MVVYSWTEELEPQGGTLLRKPAGGGEPAVPGAACAAAEAHLYLAV